MQVRLAPQNLDDYESVARWVRAYFSHDGLRYEAKVEAAINQLLANPELGQVWEIHTSEHQEAVGYTVMTYGFDHEVGGRTGVITDFYLRQEFRGMGIGTKVIDLWKAHARDTGLHQLELFVLNHNKDAKKLYQRSGFQELIDREQLILPLD